MPAMGYETMTTWPGVLAHHADSCPKRDGGPCTCGVRGYRAQVHDPQRPAPVLGPVFPTINEADVWRREQQAATDAWHAVNGNGNGDGDGHMNGHGSATGNFNGNGHVNGNGTFGGDGHVNGNGHGAMPPPRRPPPGAPGPSVPSVSSVVDQFLDAAANGRARDARGHSYGEHDVADLRWSLRALEGVRTGAARTPLGELRIAELDGSELRALVERLDGAGLSHRRTRSVVGALRALLRFAAERRLVPASAADLLTFGGPDEQTPLGQTPLPQAAATQTPQATPLPPPAPGPTPDPWATQGYPPAPPDPWATQGYPPEPPDPWATQGYAPAPPDPWATQGYAPAPDPWATQATQGYPPATRSPSGAIPDEVIWLILKIVALVFALIALVLVAESV
jgi:hypothetical protein